jgi:hypothetical protein
MQLNSITLDAKAVIMKVVANKETDDCNDLIESKITAREEPLASLTKAWNALPGVFCEIMELDNSYTEGLTITKLSIRRTKQGTRSVILEATKQLECRSEFLHTMSTPCVQIDKAADGESGAVQLEKKLCDKVHKAIHEAERYMEGERSQTLLNFDDAKAALQATADLGKGDMLTGMG